MWSACRRRGRSSCRPARRSTGPAAWGWRGSEGVCQRHRSTDQERRRGTARHTPFPLPPQAATPAPEWAAARRSGGDRRGDTHVSLLYAAPLVGSPRFTRPVTLPRTHPHRWNCNPPRQGLQRVTRACVRSRALPWDGLRRSELYRAGSWDPPCTAPASRVAAPATHLVCCCVYVTHGRGVHGERAAERVCRGTAAAQAPPGSGCRTSVAPATPGWLALTRMQLGYCWQSVPRGRMAWAGKGRKTGGVADLSSSEGDVITQGIIGRLRPPVHQPSRLATWSRPPPLADMPGTDARPRLWLARGAGAFFSPGCGKSMPLFWTGTKGGASGGAPRR